KCAERDVPPGPSYPTWEFLPSLLPPSSSIRRSISVAGKRRWPPKVDRWGIRPSFAHRETVFGETCSIFATSDVRRNFSPGYTIDIATFGRRDRPLVGPASYE